MSYSTFPPTPPTGTNAPGSPEILADTSPGPFEGPEKLLEVWFAPSPSQVPVLDYDVFKTPGPIRASAHAAHARTSPTPNTSPAAAPPPAAAAEGEAAGGDVSAQGDKAWRGLRAVPRSVWEDMLKVVKCQVLSVIEGDQVDAYLLSESSLFVAPHVIILKTCGTTLNLLGLRRIIDIARQWCGFEEVYRCFYSRKSFFFPELQVGPHRDWTAEVDFLDGVFEHRGAAYTVGPMNGDHWLLYVTAPPSSFSPPSGTPDNTAPPSPQRPTIPHLPVGAIGLNNANGPRRPPQDTTLEILMTHLSPNARAPFFHPEDIDPSCSQPTDSSRPPRSGHHLGQVLTAHLGIDKLFPASETTIDSFGFEPCGYSANAVIGSGSNNVAHPEAGEGNGGYFTIHVTPEEGWSFASFECNVPLPLASQTSPAGRPDLRTLIRQVVDIFEPGRLSITLFLSTPDELSTEEETLSRQAWSGFSKDLLGKEYTRKDRIGYEFEGYDLVFGCFEKKGFSAATQKIANGARSICS